LEKPLVMYLKPGLIAKISVTPISANPPTMNPVFVLVLNAGEELISPTLIPLSIPNPVDCEYELTEIKDIKAIKIKIVFESFIFIFPFRFFYFLFFIELYNLMLCYNLNCYLKHLNLRN